MSTPQKPQKQAKKAAAAPKKVTITSAEIAVLTGKLLKYAKVLKGAHGNAEKKALARANKYLDQADIKIPRGISPRLDKAYNRLLDCMPEDQQCGDRQVEVNREPRYFFVQSNSDYGYFLFPHQDLDRDSFKLPSLCQCNGHPTEKDEKWESLSNHPGTFQTGDRVVLYQAGNPNWLRGFWGYGVIKKSGDDVYIRTERLLAFPLILNERMRRVLIAKFIKAIIDPMKSAAYRAAYAKISNDDFNALTDAIDRQQNVRPTGSREKKAPEVEAPNATAAFKKWAKGGEWKVFGPGYPDLLAELPNRRIAAFEAKLLDDLRADQKEMFRILSSVGLHISILKETPNKDAAQQIEQHHWKVIARDIGPNTRGWPDFVLQKGSKVVAVELKTGWQELVSDMQIATLSALSSELGLEVHVVRAIKDHEDDTWKLYDDTERWLLYPPGRARH